MNRAATAFFCVVLLAGCDGEYRKAHDKILCDEDDNAYHARPGVGETSFIKPMPAANMICVQRKGNPR